MTFRTVTTVLTATIAGFQGAMQKAAQSAIAAGQQIAGAATKSSAEWDRVGGGLLKGGAVIAAGLGLATKAAMDWESQFAGVKKTVDGTPQQIDALEGSLRGMARTMAASHEEIASVAEAAGQLGVATPAIAGFTKTMIMLGETTNLTSDEAATSLAQMMNVMQTAPDKVGNLASTLVALGNAGASTESEILGLTQRIASAGRQIGLSEDQVMAYASALANVGVEVEAGGTAMSMTFLKLEQISRRGGTALQTVSKVAGVDFREAFEDDAAGATQKFIEGLGRVQAAGGDVTGILRTLGITGVREADAIRRLASSGTNLADQMRLAEAAIKGQDALLNEYSKRAATTEAQVTVAWNNIKDSAITAGSALLPVVQQGADGLANMAQAFGALSPGQQRFAVGAAAAAAGLLLVVGGGMKAIGMVRDLKDNLTGLGVNFSGVGDKAKGMAAKMAAAATGVTALALAISLMGANQRNNAQSFDQVTKNVETLSKAGVDLALINKQITDALRGDALSSNIKGIGDAFKSLSDMDRMGTGWFNDTLDLTGFKTATGVMKDEISKIDGGLKDLVAGGNLTGAQEAFRKLTDSLPDGVTLEYAAGYFTQYRAQLEQTAASLGNLQVSDEEYARWMRGEIPAAVKAATDAGSPLVKNLTGQQRAMAGLAGAAAEAVTAMEQYTSLTAQMAGGEIGFKAALAEASKGLKERGKGLDINTEKGRANQTSLLQIAQASKSVLEGMKTAGAGPETLAAKADKMRTSLARVAHDMGMGKEEAKAYAASLIAIPTDVAPTFSAPGATIVKQQADLLAAAVKDIPELAETKILAVGARPSKAEVDTFMESVKGLPKETRSKIRLIAELGGLKAGQEAYDRFKNKQVEITAKAAGVSAVKGAIAGIGGKTVNINVKAVGVAAAKAAIASIKAGGHAYGGLIHPGGAASLAGFRPVARLATGGTVPGQSPNPRADDVPIWATAGEFMQPVSSVNYYGLGVMEALRRQLVPRQFFTAIGLADGGSVDPYSVAASRPVYPSQSAMADGLAATRQTVVQVTNHYPQAEPTSITTNRALQYVAAMGL